MWLQPIRSPRTDNCFVRLHPQTVQALCDEAIRQTSSSSPRRLDTAKVAPSTTAATDWSIASADLSANVDFLPLQLIWGDGRVVFASYNGGQIQENGGIEIPHNLDSNNTLDESSELFVKIVPYCPVAKELSLMPKTANEYQFMQLEAEHLEYGGLLQQISVVGTQNKQDVTITVASGTVQLRVIEQKDDEDGWPSPSCWRLVNDTEILVLPPLSATTEHKNGLRRIPCRQDMIDSDEMKRLAMELFEDSETRWVDLPPKTVAVHPSTGMKNCIATLRCEDSSAVVRVLTSLVVPDGKIAIHPLLVHQLQPVVSMESSDCEFTLEALKEDVVQENAIQFLEYQRGRDIVFQPVQWGDGELPLWHIPNVFNDLTNNKPQTLDFRKVLECMDKETPIALNDLFCTAVDGYCDVTLYGKLAAGVEGGVFGFAGDLLEQTSMNSDAAKQNLASSSAKCKTPNRCLKTLVPRASVFRKELISFVKGLGPQRGCVVCGDLGTGKTHSALMLAAAKKQQTGSETFYLDCRALKHSTDSRMRTILQQLEGIDGRGYSSMKPKTFIIDNVDVFIAGRVSQAGSQQSAQTVDADDTEIDQSKLILDVLSTRIVRLNDCIGPRGNFFVMTCETMANLDQFLKECELWGNVFTIDPLDALERSQIFRSSMIRSGVTCPDQIGLGFEKLSVGFRCRDFDKLAARLRCEGVSSSSLEIEAELRRLVPICRIDVPLSARNNAVKLKAMGALFEPKRCLDETVIRPSRYRRIYSAAKIRLPRGLLLYGYPGTGKTTLAAALANECGFSLVSCSGPELLDKYIGASEAKVRELFYRASSAAPSILFFDEFDALAPRRGSDNSGVTDRIVNQLLTFLDGVSDLSKNEGEVFIVAASSRPDKIDPALLRPGRLEKHIFCGLVDDSMQRQDLLLKLSSQYPLDRDLAASISSGELLESLDLPKNGLSGADVDGIFTSAYIKAVHEVIGCSERETDPNVTIKMSHFRLACSEASPSIPPTELNRFQSIFSVFAGKKPMNIHPNEPSQRVALR